MYLIVVGAGRIGNTIVELANRDAQEVVVIEKNEERAEEISTDYDCMVIHADATSKEILLEAGLEEADALISTTDHEEVNLMVSMLGKKYDVEGIICSVEHPEHIDLFRDLGVNVVESPHRLAGQYLYRAATQPAIKDAMDIEGAAEIVEITVSEDAPLTNYKLVDAYTEDLVGDDTIIVSVMRDGDLIIPNGQTKIKSGDLVTVLTKSGDLDSVAERFNTS